tara:strand:- start:14 stop:184 length:171 start_codon:yes stop_codon:yes gene_type:complete
MTQDKQLITVLATLIVLCLLLIIFSYIEPYVRQDDPVVIKEKIERYYKKQYEHIGK